MKVLPFKVPKPQGDALIYQEDHEQVFYDKLHQHEEIQISYIQKGHGTLIVGDTINTYRTDDVIVIGSNLPHVFKSEPSNDISSMITLFFTPDAFGPHFFDLEELGSTRQFFRKAAFGFKLKHTPHTIKSLFLALGNASKLKRFIYFIELLSRLSKSRDQALSSFIYDKRFTDDEGQRMQDIMAFTTENFDREIDLNAIASVANMTNNAFCKYFKKRTNKTYFRFLNEFRVEHASKLLLSNADYSIAEIAERSGFNNMSNFNRTFKRLKGCTPSQLKKGNVA